MAAVSPFLVAGAMLALRAPQDDLVRRASAALGARDSTDDGLVLHGTADFRGTPCRFRLSLGGGGAFVHAVDGPFGETVGSDGSALWCIDRTGAPRRLFFEDADEWRAISGLIGGRWSDDPASTREVDGDARLRVRFPSGMVETIEVDPETLLPARGTFRLHAGEVAIEMSDWRAVGSRKLPFCYRITRGGFTDTFRAEAALAATAPEHFEVPALARPDDHAFDHDAPAEIEVRPSPIHLLLVHPRLNGEDVGWFALDTGAEVMCIDPAVADRLGMPRVGRVPLTGVGGTVASAFRRAEEFRLGPLTLRRPLLCELDLKPLLSVMQENIAGVVGYDYLYRSVVEIDVAKPVVRVFDPATYELRGASWNEIRFSSGNPAVEAGFEGDRSGWFLLDTGDPSNATFFTGVVDELHLLEGRATTARESGGVGGTIPARAGRVAWLELGGHVFEDIEVLFSRATAGTFTTRGVTGSIGQELMRPFVVAYDFGGARVAFIPRE